VRISVYNQEIELLVQTVSVALNRQDPTNTYLFYCPYCSYQMFQIRGLVSKITPGLEPTSNVVVVNRCPRCEMRYTIQEQRVQPTQTEVVLTRFGNKETVFRCYICRTPGISFADDVILLPSIKPVKLPIHYTCRNVKCGAHYYITDVI